MIVMQTNDLDPKIKKLLLAVPKRIDAEWVRENDKVVIIYKKNFSRLEKFLHKHLGGPEDVRVVLDDKGTAIWEMCDGNTNIKDICTKLDEKYKEEIEPVFPRTWKFLEMLIDRNLIRLEVPED
ncbi:MAG: PqqD family protein [Thermoplasmata archaeon]